MKALRAGQNGFSLVELMIAVVIGLLIIAGMGNLFLQTKNSFRQDEVVARMQEDARFALEELRKDLSMAGFWGPVMDGSQITNHSTGVPAADPFDNYDAPLVGADAVTGGQTFDWTTLTDAVADSDAVSVRRVEGATTAVPGSSSFYIETNGTVAIMIKGDAAPTGSASPEEYWEYDPTIYYVRSFCRAGDGIPSLVKLEWVDGVQQTNCIAQGVETLQVEYGLDTDGDGFPERYQNGLAAADAGAIAAVRVSLLARGSKPDSQYSNEKTYTIANYSLDKSAAPDNFYRRVYSTTVQTRNPTNLRTL